MRHALVAFEILTFLPVHFPFGDGDALIRPIEIAAILPRIHLRPITVSDCGSPLPLWNVHPVNKICIALQP